MIIKWSAEDKQFIKDRAGDLIDKELAIQLSLRNGRPVSLGAIRKLRQRLGISNKSGRGVCALEENNGLLRSTKK